MGCCQSKSSELKAQEVRLRVSTKDKAGDSQTAESRTRKASQGAQGTAESQATAVWSALENAEESAYLKETGNKDEAGLESALKTQFPNLVTDRSHLSEVSHWRSVTSEVPHDAGEFELLPPFTMEKASAFYRHLCRTDARRRNPKKALPDNAPVVSRRSVYEVMTAAFELYDTQAKARGALQRVPPPASSAEKLRVCGDTHGQLQDVLWIFDEHGEPSAQNAYLFNGDIADRGRHAVEIYLLVLAYQLAEPRSICASPRPAVLDTRAPPIPAAFGV